MDTHARTEEEPAVLAHRDGGVLELTLHHPQRRNALAVPLRVALIERLREALSDPEVRAIVLTGSGRHFCAGGDISGMEGVTPMGARTRLGIAHEMIRLLVQGEKPVIAAVEGHAAGAGVSLAAVCDLVVAARDATFTCSFNRIGLVPDLGAAWVLPLRMGMGRAKRLMLLGRPMDAAAAERAGLVDELCESGQALDTARALARAIAERSPFSAAMTKALLGRASQSLDEALRSEADAQAILFQTEDFREGRDAFLEKRPPVFRGR